MFASVFALQRTWEMILVSILIATSLYLTLFHALSGTNFFIPHKI